MGHYYFINAGGLGGWALYNIVPATGPVYVFADSFPWRALPYKALPRLFLELVPVNSDSPRNAIPSLHMAWAMLLYWNDERLGAGAGDLCGGVCGADRGIDARNRGHYFVDLVAGVPFAMAVQAVVSPDRREAFSRRAMAASAGLALTVAWLLLVRFGARAMLVSPILPWSLVVASGAAVWRIKAWFDGKQELASAPNGIPQANAYAAGQD